MITESISGQVVTSLTMTKVEDRKPPNRCLLFVQNFEVAEEHYRKAISLEWRSADAHYNLGCLLQHQKDDMVEAERQYRHAVKCDPKHGMAQYNLGWMLEKVIVFHETRQSSPFDYRQKLA